MIRSKTPASRMLIGIVTALATIRVIPIYLFTHTHILFVYRFSANVGLINHSRNSSVA